MAWLGRLLRNRRAGAQRLAWNAPNLAAEGLLVLTSPDFIDGQAIPLLHAARRVGGGELSPALFWSRPPAGAEELMLVIEDADAPTPSPFVHCLALLDVSLTSLPQGGLSARRPAPGVRLLRSTIGRGFVGPAPIKGHGPHHYVFQLFALSRAVRRGPGGRPLESSRAREVIAAVEGVMARGRLEGTYERS